MSLTVSSRKRPREDEGEIIHGQGKHAKVQSPFQELPPELINHIFSFLPQFEPLTKQSVCKTFKQVVTDYCPTKVHIERGKHPATADTILLKLKKFPIERVEISCGFAAQSLQTWPLPGLTAVGLAAFKGYTNLKTLDLFGCHEITDVVCAHHLSQLNTLTDLSIRNCDRITDVGFFHISRMSSLSELHLIGCRITDAGLAHFSESHHLTILGLGVCIAVSNEGLVHLGKLKNLTELRLYETRITDDGLSSLEGLSQLTVLDLSGTRDGPKGFASLSQVIKSEVPLIEDRSSFAPHCFRDIEQLPFLSSISLQESTITDEIVDDLLKFKQLKELDIDDAIITRRNLSRLVNGLPEGCIVGDPVLVDQDDGSESESEPPLGE